MYLKIDKREVKEWDDMKIFNKRYDLDESSIRIGINMYLSQPIKRDYQECLLLNVSEDFCVP